MFLVLACSCFLQLHNLSNICINLTRVTTLVSLAHRYTAVQLYYQIKTNGIQSKKVTPVHVAYQVMVNLCIFHICI